MSDAPVVPDALWPLIDAALSGSISVKEADELRLLLANSHEARKAYCDYTSLELGLHLLIRGQRASLAVSERINAESDAGDTRLPCHTMESFPSVPMNGVLDTTPGGTFGNFFFSDAPTAYLLATLVVGIGLAIMAIVPASQSTRFARHWQPAMEQHQTIVPKAETIGKITGMVGCKWGNSDATAILGNTVQIGQKYMLVSGLMEISYDTGAKVILQGPVSYEVETKNGGFLSLGKLTGTVSEASAKGFAIRTPTAVVTDLGTEFGVEVDEHGATTSHVFRGSVRIQMATRAGHVHEMGKVVHENESARVDISEHPFKDDDIKVVVESRESGRFVRSMPMQAVHTLDLADVVAGGDGYSGKRSRGINPLTGLASDVQPEAITVQGDFRYHRTEGIPFVDGVFIPNGDKGPVQIDSTGRFFADFPKTDNNSWAYIWAGGKLPAPIAARLTPTLSDVDYSSPKHAVLVMHANKGITFDLNAIRQSNPNLRPVRFRAVAGNVETTSSTGVSADIWVLVDGEVRFKRREVNRYTGVMPISVAIAEKDRFLTLAVTDGDNSYLCDQIIFGDPRLELTPKTSAGNSR